MNPPTIRPANAADFAPIAAINNHYIRTTAVHFGYAEVTATELAQLWRDHQDVYPWLVAVDGDEVLGYAKAGMFRSRTAYRWITETGVYLAPQHCGRGLGLPLYAQLLQLLQLQGFHAAIGVIALPNDRSVRLHERLGFRNQGVLPQAGWKFERWHDVGLWQALLQSPQHAAAAIATPAQAAANHQPPTISHQPAADAAAPATASRPAIH
jgi:L-amino acid N-acyltransferase YncA